MGENLLTTLSNVYSDLFHLKLPDLLRLKTSASNKKHLLKCLFLENFRKIQKEEYEDIDYNLLVRFLVCDYSIIDGEKNDEYFSVVPNNVLKTELEKAIKSLELAVWLYKNTANNLVQKPKPKHMK